MESEELRMEEPGEGRVRWGAEDGGAGQGKGVMASSEQHMEACTRVHTSAETPALPCLFFFFIVWADPVFLLQNP